MSITAVVGSSVPMASYETASPQVLQRGNVSPAAPMNTLVPLRAWCTTV